MLTTGGTGFAPGDVTPEATRDVIEREAPGSPRRCGRLARAHPALDALRAVAGIRGATLIVNFPGSPRSIAETGEALAAALPHGLRLLGGGTDAH